MNGTDAGLRAATAGALALVVVALLMNTCAMDRLEKQVIRQTKALEGIAGGGGGAPRQASAQPSGGAPAASGGSAEPGTGTGFEAVGWGGRRAEILHVEGAVPNAPLTVAQKPHPQGDVFVSRRNSPPSTLNYYATTEGETTTITALCLGRMMELNLEDPTQVIPSLATSWEVAADKLTYIYHLRKGVQFADGRPFSSADVKFSFDVMRDPAVKADAIRTSFDDVASLETPDASTVVVKYRRKYWKGIYTVGYVLRILNKAWYEEQVPLWARKLDIKKFSTEPGKPGFGEVFNRITVIPPGTMAFYYAAETYDPTKSVDLVQNPFYFGTQVYPTWWNLKGYRTIFISDEVAAFEEFRKQKFDISVVDPPVWDDELSKDATVTSISKYFEYDFIAIAFSYIEWNGRKPPFDDPRVRRAMTMLCDREWMLKEILRGRGTIATVPTKAAYPSFSPDIAPIPFDIEGARKLLAEAGWKDTDGDGILDRNGKRFEFDLKYGSARRFYVQVGTALQDACKKVGIRMTPRNLEWATFIEDYNQRRFDASILYASFPDPWIDPYDGYHSSQDIPNGGNAAGWHDAKADAIMEQMRQEFDEGKRNELFRQFNHEFAEQQPETLLISDRVSALVNKRFQGIKPRMAVGLLPKDWWVEPKDVLYK